MSLSLQDQGLPCIMKAARVFSCSAAWCCFGASDGLCLFLHCVLCLCTSGHTPLDAWSLSHCFSFFSLQLYEDEVCTDVTIDPPPLPYPNPSPSPDWGWPLMSILISMTKLFGNSQNWSVLMILSIPTITFWFSSRHTALYCPMHRPAYWYGTLGNHTFRREKLFMIIYIDLRKQCDILYS